MVLLVSVDGGDGLGQRAVLVLELVSPIVLPWPALLVPVLLVVESGVGDGQHVDLAPVLVTHVDLSAAQVPNGIFLDFLSSNYLKLHSTVENHTRFSVEQLYTAVYVKTTFN